MEGATCTLTLFDNDATVSATFAERCTAGATDPTCIRVVYIGAPDDYTEVSDIPENFTFTPNSGGRYEVGRGEQITVVTGGASLPAGYTRFYLQRAPLTTSPSPVSASQLIPPVGTTYTFTPTSDPVGAALITFDLTAARPHPVRPTHKPELGDVVVTTSFQVVTCDSGIAVPDPTTNTELVEDCKTLLTFKDTLAGTATLNWSAGRPITAWTGITTAGTPQRVTKLELANSSLSGTLPPELGDLTALTHLRLNDNHLTGVIPSPLGQLTNLTHAYLGGNNLRGCVPTTINSATNNDASALDLAVCSPPAQIGEATPENLGVGTYRLGREDSGIVFDVPQGLTVSMFLVFPFGGEEGRYVFAVGVDHDDLVHDATGTLAITWSGEFASLWVEPPSASARGTGAATAATTPSTRELLEKLARSVRVVAEEPTQVGTSARTTGPDPIDIFSPRDPLSRNLIIARTIHVCSDYPNTTKDALALWNSALRSTSTDGDFRLLVNHQVFRFVEDDDEDPNYHCDNAEITSPEMGIDSIAIRSVDKAKMLQLGCEGGGDPWVACWVSYNSGRPYYTYAGRRSIYVYDQEVPLSADDEGPPKDDDYNWAYLVMAHELGHAAGLPDYSYYACDQENPVKQLMSNRRDSKCTLDYDVFANIRLTNADYATYHSMYHVYPSLIQRVSSTVPYLKAGPRPRELTIQFNANSLRNEKQIEIWGGPAPALWTNVTKFHVATLQPDRSDSEWFIHTYSDQRTGVETYYRFYVRTDADKPHDNQYVEHSITLPTPPPPPPLPPEPLCRLVIRAGVGGAVGGGGTGCRSYTFWVDAHPGYCLVRWDLDVPGITTRDDPDPQCFDDRYTYTTTMETPSDGVPYTIIYTARFQARSTGGTSGVSRGVDTWSWGAICFPDPDLTGSGGGFLTRQEAHDAMVAWLDEVGCFSRSSESLGVYSVPGGWRWWAQCFNGSSGGQGGYGTEAEAQAALDAWFTTNCT